MPAQSKREGKRSRGTWRGSCPHLLHSLSNFVVG